jgi:hypothetical protein
MRRAIVAMLYGGLLLAWPAVPAFAEVLITEAEAKLPNAPDASMTMRGITRGPGIEQVSPNPDHSVSAPFPLKIKFQIRNNVAIDPDTVKLALVKAKPVDLTERVKKHLTEDGIEMSRADVPPGTYLLRLDVKDKQGRAGIAIIKLQVATRK